MNKYIQTMKNGLINENPIFVQVLGMCSVLAISTTLLNGIGMGLAVTFVLICSNFVISLLRNFIPKQVRIAGYIVIIATFVTIIDLLMQAYLPDLSESLGVFIPLIVVNCIILGRAEAFASKNKPLLAVADGLFMGLGYTFAICLISTIREILGNGSILGIPLFGGTQPCMFLSQPVGGFLTLGTVMALVQFIRNRNSKKKEAENK